MLLEGEAGVYMASSGATEEGKSHRKMQFILKQGGRCGPRVGKLIWATPTPQQLPLLAPPLDTPLCFLYSRGGAIPNLTRDLEEDMVRHVTGNESDERAAAAIMLTMPTLYAK